MNDNKNKHEAESSPVQPEETKQHQNPFAPDEREPISEEEIEKEQEYKEALTERD